MFGRGSKYLSERLKLERVYKYALRMANDLQLFLVSFSERSWPSKIPVAAQGMSVSFHIELDEGAYLRTVGWTGGSDVITKPKFLALMG